MTIQYSKKILSWKVRFLTYFWLFYPLWYPVLAVIGFDVGASGVAKLLLSPAYWVTALFCIATGMSLKLVRWYAWYLFVFCNLIVCYETAWTLVYLSESLSKPLLFLMMSCVQLLSIYFVGNDVRVPYISPRTRWWESDPRYKFQALVRIRIGEDLTTYQGEIIDISQGGCFIKTRMVCQLHQEIGMEFEVFDEALSLQGEIVWKTEATITHPRGIGVRFSRVQKDQLQGLKRITKQLKGLNRKYQVMTRERSWNDYVGRSQKDSNSKKKSA